MDMFVIKSTRLFFKSTRCDQMDGAHMGVRRMGWNWGSECGPLIAPFATFCHFFWPRVFAACLFCLRVHLSRFLRKKRFESGEAVLIDGVELRLLLLDQTLQLSVATDHALADAARHDAGRHEVAAAEHTVAAGRWIWRRSAGRWRGGSVVDHLRTH